MVLTLETRDDVTVRAVSAPDHDARWDPEWGPRGGAYAIHVRSDVGVLTEAHGPWICLASEGICAVWVVDGANEADVIRETVQTYRLDAAALAEARRVQGKIATARI